MYKALIVVVIAAVFAVVVFSNSLAYMEHGNAKFVYDSKSVDNTIVSQIHQYLIDNTVYQNHTGELFLIKKSDDVWLVKFPVYQGGDVPSDVLKAAEQLSRNLQQNFLNNEPLEIHITNASYQSVQFFKI